MQKRLRGFASLAVGLTLAVSLRAENSSLPPKRVLDGEFLTFGLPVRAQGERDVCSLFAITGLVEFELSRFHVGPHARLSQEYLIWAANAATGMTGDQAMFWEATYGLEKLGVCDYDLMPYSLTTDPARKPTPAAIKQAQKLSECWKVMWIKRWNMTEPLTVVQLEKIKRAIVGGHPVACGLRWPKKLNGSEILAVLPANDVADGHSIEFTGYEDDKSQPGGGVFHFRNSWGENWGQNGFGRMSYGYAQAYANDAVWLQLEPAGSENPLHRFEAESLPIVTKEKCQTSVQKMDAFGGPLWSHREQLFCSAVQGSVLVLRFTVPTAQSYRARLLATSAPDFGRIHVQLDGKEAGPEFNLYAGRVCPSGSLELGTHDLSQGDHTLRVHVDGKDGVSAGFSFGLDALDLLRVK